MARPLRLEFPGAVYHIMARGNRRETIYLQDADFSEFLSLLAEVHGRFKWLVHAYCLMTNHYHLLIETPDANLSRGMRHLNGVYTQRFNRRHQRVGHLFQGRYKALLVQKETHLLELSRYIVLNPVRAQLVSSVDDWQWSSYRYTVGAVTQPPWLETGWLLAQFGQQRSSAATAYQRYVTAGMGAGNPFRHIEDQLYLGDATFADRLRDKNTLTDLSETSPEHRRAMALTLPEYACRWPRDEAMARAYLSGAYTMREIAAYHCVHYMTVSRAVQRLRKLLEC